MFKNLLLLGLGLVNHVMAVPDQDLVNNLPGITLDKPLYSGFLKVTDTKSLHYMFIESKQGTRANDPVLIWFNGGPGCSSLLGFFQENGPMIVTDDGQISENNWGWNREANVLYIESPAGVGFSVAGADGDWQHNDMSQAEDAFTAL